MLGRWQCDLSEATTGSCYEREPGSSLPLKKLSLVLLRVHLNVILHFNPARQKNVALYAFLFKVGFILDDLEHVFVLRKIVLWWHIPPSSSFPFLTTHFFKNRMWNVCYHFFVLFFKVINDFCNCLTNFIKVLRKLDYFVFQLLLAGSISFNQVLNLRLVHFAIFVLINIEIISVQLPTTN